MDSDLDTHNGYQSVTAAEDKQTNEFWVRKLFTFCYTHVIADSCRLPAIDRQVRRLLSTS